jgi:hypothetical protein
MFSLLLCAFLLAVGADQIDITVSCGNDDCGISGPWQGVQAPVVYYLTCTNETPAGSCANHNMGTVGTQYAFNGVLYPTLTGGADNTGRITCNLGDTITFRLTQNWVQYGGDDHPFYLLWKYLPVPYLAKTLPQFVLNNPPYSPFAITMSGTYGSGTPASPVLLTITYAPLHSRFIFFSSHS